MRRNDDVSFAIGIFFTVTLIGILIFGAVRLGIREDNKITNQFKQECTDLGGTPVVKSDRLCIKDSKVIFQR